MEAGNKLIAVLAILALVYFLLLNSSQKEVVSSQSVHALSTAKTFVQGGVAAVRENSATKLNSSGDGNTTFIGG